MIELGAPERFYCCDGDDTAYYRTKIIGGWLIEIREIYRGNLFKNIVFVPDANHAWDAETLESQETPKISLDASIHELYLTVKSARLLEANNILTVKELIAHSSKELFKFPNLGKKSLTDIINALAEVGLTLKKDSK